MSFYAVNLEDLVVWSIRTAHGDKERSVVSECQTGEIPILARKTDELPPATIEREAKHGD